MIYEIRIENGLDRSWTAWFDGMQVTTEPGGVTIIAGAVIDQAALHGVLATIRDLGLTLVSVRRIAAHGEPESHSETHQP